MNLYAWKNLAIVVYTITENPVPGDYIYKNDGTKYEDGELTYSALGYTLSYSNTITEVVTDPESIRLTARYGSITQTNGFGRVSNEDIVIVEPENLVSKFVHDGVTYIIKDAQAREDIANIFPDQTSQSGKFLTTNGSSVSWATVDALPSQTGQNGKFLTTNGITASWAEVQSGGNVTVNTINKTLLANTTSVNTEVDLSQAVILNVYVNGIYQIGVTNYNLTTTSGETTITFTESFPEDTTVSIVYATNVNIINVDYSVLTNKPKINNVELKGNKTLADLGITEIPLQIGQSGKFLTTNGITTSWETVSSGTTDYNNLSNKPSINTVELKGSKTLSDLGIQGVLPVQTAYTSKGTSAKVAQISTNNFGQVTNITEVDIEAIKNQDNLRTTPIKVWTGDRANYKQAAFNNWISSTSPVTLGETFSQCYGVGKFLIIPGYYTANNNYIYSTDGKNWTASILPIDASIQRVRARWVHDRFISLCRNSQYEYSFDGINWLTGTFPITDAVPWDIAYGNGKFVVVFQNATDTAISINKAAYSEDGINWTVSTITNSQGSGSVYWRLITFFKDKFITFRVNSSMVAYSSDGITWTTTTISSGSRYNYYWAANNGEICVACCNNRSRYATSTDGINWTERNFPNGDGHRHNVIYDGVRFVALPAASSETGQSSMVATVLISTDGLNWTYSDKSVPVAGEYLSVTYGDNKIVAIENNTTNIITQEYTPLSTINPDYLCFVEDTKIQLGSNEIVNTSDKENISNKVTSISSSSTDTEYPTAKCVYDLVGDIESILDRLITGGGVTNVNS